MKRLNRTAFLFFATFIVASCIDLEFAHGAHVGPGPAECYYKDPKTGNRAFCDAAMTYTLKVVKTDQATQWLAVLREEYPSLYIDPVYSVDLPASIGVSGPNYTGQLPVPAYKIYPEAQGPEAALTTLLFYKLADNNEIIPGHNCSFIRPDTDASSGLVKYWSQDPNLGIPKIWNIYLGVRGTVYTSAQKDKQIGVLRGGIVQKDLLHHPDVLVAVNYYGNEFDNGAPPPPAPALSKKPIGWFDGVNATTASGWTLDPSAPNQSIHVLFFADGPAGGYPQRGHLVGDVLANIARPDVNQTTQFPGDHGFSFPIPNFNDGRTHTLWAYGISTSGIGSDDNLLSGSPKTVAPSCGPSTPGYSCPGPQAVKCGFNETVVDTCGKACGSVVGTQCPMGKNCRDDCDSPICLAQGAKCPKNKQ